jgi:hypothetical protein
VSQPSGFAAVLLVDHSTGKALAATVWNGGGKGSEPGTWSSVIYIGDWSGMLRAYSVNGDASEHGDALSPPCQSVAEVVGTRRAEHVIHSRSRRSGNPRVDRGP